MPSGARKRAVRLVIALLLGAASWSAAQSISYTVQVVALSDRDAALTVVSDLLRQGYPAYVVRSTSTQGDVFRVRVGAYANRGAAALYAAAMPAVAGGQPVPALAEAIPPGITPLAPRLLVQEQTPGADVRLVGLAGALGVRIQRRAPLAEAEYLLISPDGAVERVRAWQLVVREGGERVRVRDLTLWPESWREDSAEVREGFRSSLIGLVAERLGVPAEQVAGAEYRAAEDEAPRLIVVERLVPGSPDVPELLGIGLPASGLTPSGPVAYLGLDSSELPGLPGGVRVDVAGAQAEGAWNGEPVRRPMTLQGDEGATTFAPVEGDGWNAVPDGPFVRLTLAPLAEGETTAEAPGAEEGASGPPAEEQGPDDDGPADSAQAAPSTAPQAVSWRAAVGLPLWSDGPRLVAVHEQTLLIYDFLPR